ncbi:MAG: family 10 glycosylhydrolase [Candidatus Omnitrophica bacterium]|nr:family 10 glycosylhydrolase [Candidatus Omnitrophota bacterium]
MRVKKYQLGIVFLMCLYFAQSSLTWAEDGSKRALFVSVIEDQQVLSSGQEIDTLIDFAKKTRINTLFVQVYRSNQSWFPSQVADSQPYQQNLKSVGQDSLALLISKAHAQGIQVHAWMNLLSLGINTDAPILQKYGADVLTRNLGRKKVIEDYKIDSQYFLEPGDPRVRADLAVIVADLVGAYPELDGIQFDYIRYPDWQPHYGQTAVNRQRFKTASGLKEIDENSFQWKDWQRTQVTELLTMLIKKARAIRPDIQISTTGCMPYSRAYAEAFQSWAAWIDSGLIDFVTIMNYSPDPVEFAQWNQAIKNQVKDFSKVKIGVGTYKFANAPQDFEKEFLSCEVYEGTCAIFYYGSVRTNPTMVRFLEKE